MLLDASSQHSAVCRNHNQALGSKACCHSRLHHTSLNPRSEVVSEQHLLYYHLESTTTKLQQAESVFHLILSIASSPHCFFIDLQQLIKKLAMQCLYILLDSFFSGWTLQVIYVLAGPPGFVHSAII